jgi:hypothetical protein
MLGIRDEVRSVMKLLVLRLMINEELGSEEIFRSDMILSRSTSAIILYTAAIVVDDEAIRATQNAVPRHESHRNRIIPSSSWEMACGNGKVELDRDAHRNRSSLYHLG